MNYNKKTVQDVDVKGKKVLLRCDFNVPQDKETGAITSDKRIVAALPTIKYLLDNGAAVIACSHLGKPKGEWKMKLTLAPVAERLSQLLGQEVIFAKDIVGEDAKAKAAALQPGQISEPVRSQFGLHIIKMEERKDASVQPFAEVEAEVRATLAKQEGVEKVNDVLDSLIGDNINNRPLQESAANAIVSGGLSVRQTEALVKRLSAEKKEAQAKDPDEVDYLAEAQNELKARLCRGVKIVPGRKKGRIELEYYGVDDLNDLLDALAVIKVSQLKKGPQA